MDASHLAFKEAAFHSVISFEVIEHIGDVSSYLNEIKRTVSKAGITFLSTPVKQSWTVREDGRPINRYHKREYTKDEFQMLIGQYFRSISVYGEHDKARTSLVDLLEETSKSKTRNLLRMISPGFIKKLYVWLKTSKKALDALEGKSRLDDIQIDEHVTKDCIAQIAVCSNTETSSDSENRTKSII